MSERESRLETIAATVRPIAQAERRILGLYLFGSLVDGTATPESDIDLGVLFDGATSLADRVRLEVRLSDALGANVDLVDVGTCEAFLAFAIISGERLYCSDPDRCDEFDLYVMRRAGDLEPFERERRRMLLALEPVATARGARSA
ncbi:MAG: nucleotidyltransferase domain-containing protein [bacterium]|nr:nucleotidyltransferase domain-containing protein [bacterium]